MTIVGFNFTKISVERKEGAKGKISINNNVKIKEIKDYSISLGKSKQKGLRFIFEFKTEYEPKYGSILLDGEVLFLGPDQFVDDVLKDWKKNKKIPKELSTPILNTVLSKSNIKALMLSQDVNLPSPIPLPKIKVDVSKKK